eukprot:6213346-Pleurochrysis_carterae.AAC.5
MPASLLGRGLSTFPHADRDNDAREIDSNICTAFADPVSTNIVATHDDSLANVHGLHTSPQNNECHTMAFDVQETPRMTTDGACTSKEGASEIKVDVVCAESCSSSTGKKIETSSYISSQLTVRQLKEMCREHGVPVNGDKKTLMKRLETVICNASGEEEKSD